MRQTRCAFRALMFASALAVPFRAVSEAKADLNDSGAPAKRPSHELTSSVSARLPVTLTTRQGEPTMFSLTAPDTRLDCSAVQAIEIDVVNLSDRDLLVNGSASNNADANSTRDTCSGLLELKSKDRGTLIIRLMPRPADPTYEPFAPFYMYFTSLDVRSNTVDPSAIANVSITLLDQVAGSSVRVNAVRLSGQAKPGPTPFFPFIDEFGQYMHTDWPGKVFSQADLDRARLAESAQNEADLPEDWSRFGGWAKGPRLEATCHFRVAKHAGKWWFVDPEGYLFWSNGPTGVGFGGDVTPITDRLNWFASLPESNPDAQPFFKDFNGAHFKYYKTLSYRGFYIQGYNLFRKYGKDYEAKVIELCHQRLRSWGFNTLGNWSSPEVFAKDRTPYVVAVHYGAPTIHERMPDVFDPAWEPAMRAAVKTRAESTCDDPWNIGYFVDNERFFGPGVRGATITAEVFKNGATRPAKLRMVDLFKTKYQTIEALNSAWGTSFASWNAMLNTHNPPDLKNPTILADAGDFGSLFIDRYFSACKAAVKEYAPHKLYLGSRLNGHVDHEVMAIVGKYADVVSYNIYEQFPSKRLARYADLDLPFLVSEWGVGSDSVQSPFRDERENRPQSPEGRVKFIHTFLEDVVQNPNIVGAHFFQYRDQPLSGRADGEGLLRGLVNITDAPRLEMVHEFRASSRTLYPRRFESQAPATQPTKSK